MVGGVALALHILKTPTTRRRCGKPFMIALQCEPSGGKWKRIEMLRRRLKGAGRGEDHKKLVVLLH
tara:strand:+ start:232 stop:429 length:198 start_codon:yes stop_codon:yes gene_type:complete